MSTEITRRSGTDVAAAQEVVNRHRSGDAVDAGQASAAAAASPEMRAVNARIKEITALAHTGKLADGKLYEELQGELAELVAEKTALLQGRATRAAPAPVKASTVARRSSMDDVPDSVQDYPSWPDDGTQPAELQRQNSHAWLRALPKFMRIGLSFYQVKELAKIARDAADDQDAYAAEFVETERENSLRALQRRYGANWEADRDRANAYMRQLLPAGGSRDLCNLRLADGRVLGDHALFGRLLIEFARDALTPAGGRK